MKGKVLILIAGLLLMSLNVFAQDDVSIDSNGNVKTGVSNTNGNLEVTGASGEHGIVGSTSGTGAAGVYGINTTYGNYGILGYDSYGIFGYSGSGYAAYFQGNARVTGNLTVDGSIIGPVIGDITGVNAGIGLSGGGTSGDVTLDANTTYLQRRVDSSCTAGSSIRVINEDGTVVCETDDIGITIETDPTVNALGKATLSCSSGQVPKRDGAIWACADDMNTTYSAGTGLDLTGTTFSVELPLSLSGAAVGGIISGNNSDANGVGVYGHATNTGYVANQGGSFTSDGGLGVGVQGAATGSNGVGVSGVANGLSGIGVNGYATNVNAATNYGGFFTAEGSSGRGVFGLAMHTSGVNYGVYGMTNSASGYAGYFQGNTRVTGNLTVDGALTAPGIGDITGVMAGTGLSGGGTSGDVTLNADTAYLQRRVTGTCTGQVMVGVNTDGTASCETDDGITAETDPQVGTLTSGKWCTSDGSQVNCTTNAPVTSEADPQVGTNSLNYVSRWDGSALVTGTIYDNGNVGIGTASPNEQLEITGNLRLPATTSTTGIIKSGSNTLIHTYGTGNFFAGVNAGNLTMTGSYNAASGVNALQFNTTGSSNTASGRSALQSNTTGFYNTASGMYALGSNTIGSENTANGVAALQYNTTANKNTAIGKSALITQSYSNGGAAWDSHNTAVGFEALYSNQPTANTNGRRNTSVGSQALRANTTGYNNTASGFQALYSNTQGFQNTAVGEGVLDSNTTGNQNTAIGTSALYSNTTGSGNTAVGYSAGVSSGNLMNATAIGYGATVDASNKVVIGNSSVTSIGGYASWSNFSDQRAKTDIQDVGYGLDLIRQLRPVSFKMKNGNGNTDFGFVAQDIEALLGEKYNVLDIGGGEERMLSLRYSQFIAPMVKAMQEQQDMIDSQQVKIDSQQARIEELEQQQAQIDELKKIVEELRKRL
jgi:hypothetical protein